MDKIELKIPCNCFGTLGQFETDEFFHEMGREGCTRNPPVTTSRKDDNGTIRSFATGATRDTAEGKLDYDGFLSPLVLHTFAVHMMRHQKQADGQMRESDNWQKGIPMEQYIKSMWRHFFDVWANHRRILPVRKERIITAICALLFNVQGYLHEYLKANPEALKEFEREAGYSNEP